MELWMYKTAFRILIWRWIKLRFYFKKAHLHRIHSQMFRNQLYFSVNEFRWLCVEMKQAF